ncbi:MAG TPA: hypothetical protein VGB75_12120 [Jatrophihabitans sp.]|uniref:hypothetical protein n=1 Tax=Jatrophihabitans sp. TaxID=1932789 RepID=UPI002F0316A6
MSATTELPTWAVYAISFGTPGTALAGVLLGQLLTRRDAKELEKRSRREQVMRTLEWAAEMAISEDEAAFRLGLSQLQALAASNLNDKDVQAFVDAALDAVVKNVVDEIKEAEGTDEPVAVVRAAGPARSAAHPLDDESSLPSEDDTDEGTGDHG